MEAWDLAQLVYPSGDRRIGFGLARKHGLRGEVVEARFQGVLYEVSGGHVERAVNPVAGGISSGANNTRVDVGGVKLLVERNVFSVRRCLEPVQSFAKWV